MLASLTAVAVEPDSKGTAPGFESDTVPYLGIYEDFGRWQQGVIPIAYNHDNARSDVDKAQFLEKLLTAFEILEGVADIHFDYQGETDKSWFNYNDQLVVVGWDAASGSFDGRAKPVASNDYGDLRALGYFPYKDGSVRFNNTSNGSYSLNLILHEVIHLLGIGHSDTLYSIMNYASMSYPYPLQDDIDALQALYGPPDEFVLQTPFPESDVAISVSDITFNDEESGFAIREPGVVCCDGDTLISEIGDDLNDEGTVHFRVAYRYVPPGTKVTEVYYDPQGNIIVGEPYPLQYINGWIIFYLDTVEDMKRYPGQWTAEMYIGDILMYQESIEVTATAPEQNETPIAALSSYHEGDGKFRLNLSYSDPEDDEVNVLWHIPDYGIQADGSLEQEVSNTSGRPKQVFVQITDLVSRPHGTPGVDGSGSGEGFANLLSRWLIVPAQPGVSTFFVEEQLLYIPAVAIEGQLFSLTFKLTGLSGVALKLLEFDLVPDYSGEVLTTFDSANNKFIMDTLVVREGDSSVEIPDVNFGLDLASDPVRLELLQ